MEVCVPASPCTKGRGNTTRAAPQAPCWNSAPPAACD